MAPTETFTPTATFTPIPTATATPTVTGTPTATPFCGDGVVEIGVEQCDLGALNGQANGCCTATCTALAASTACDDGDECTENDHCDASGNCLGSLIPLGPPIVREITVEGDPVVLGSGTTTITIRGDPDNIVEAFIVDPALCHSPFGTTPTYHWTINTPLATGYTARGISGYRADTLWVLSDSIPHFVPNPITFVFTVTSGVPPFASTTTSFRGVYINSALTLGMSTTCQVMQVTGMGCDIENALAVLPGTLT